MYAVISRLRQIIVLSGRNYNGPSAGRCSSTSIETSNRIERAHTTKLKSGKDLSTPYYEVSNPHAQFVDDLAKRLRHPFEATLGGVMEFFAWVDWRFQWIHPFKDFNGRIGRVLLA